MQAPAVGSESVKGQASSGWGLERGHPPGEARRRREDGRTPGLMTRRWPQGVGNVAPARAAPPFSPSSDPEAARADVDVAQEGRRTCAAKNAMSEEEPRADSNARSAVVAGC